jgi:hypothetical protein
MGNHLQIENISLAMFDYQRGDWGALGPFCCGVHKFDPNGDVIKKQEVEY